MDWLTTLLIATKVPSAPNASGIAATDPLCHGEQRNHEIARQAQQRIDVARRSDQDMTLEDRPVIKKGDYLLITRHDRSVELAADDLADHIAHRHEISVPPLRGR